MPNIQSKEDRYMHTSHSKCQISRAKKIDTYILVIVNAKYPEQRRYIDTSHSKCQISRAKGIHTSHSKCQIFRAKKIEVFNQFNSHSYSTLTAIGTDGT